MHETTAGLLALLDILLSDTIDENKMVAEMNKILTAIEQPTPLEEFLNAPEMKFPNRRETVQLPKPRTWTQKNIRPLPKF